MLPAAAALPGKQVERSAIITASLDTPAPDLRTDRYRSAQQSRRSNPLVAPAHQRLSIPGRSRHLGFPLLGPPRPHSVVRDSGGVSRISARGQMSVILLWSKHDGIGMHPMSSAPADGCRVSWQSQCASGCGDSGTYLPCAGRSRLGQYALGALRFDWKSGCRDGTMLGKSRKITRSAPCGN